MAETLPAKREQLAGTECIRHVKFQENAVSQLSFESALLNCGQVKVVRSVSRN